MYTAQNMYEQSTGFNTPWEKLPVSMRTTWERWANSANASSFEALVDDEIINQWHALIKLGFRLNTDFHIIIDVKLAGDWGGPELNAPYAPLYIRGSFKDYLKPEYTDTEIKFILSFDRLYDVKIPWNCIVGVNFHNPTEDERKTA